MIQMTDNMSIMKQLIHSQQINPRNNLETNKSNQKTSGFQNYTFNNVQNILISQELPKTQTINNSNK